jgi:pilus assembly protein CpaC
VFRLPEWLTLRASSKVDEKRDQSLIISGLFSEDRQRTRTGIPFLMDIPILGALFGTSSWQSSEQELLILVTPTIVNPNAPPSRSILNIVPDTTLPAREALEKRLPPPPIKP